MWADRVSNPGPLAHESEVLQTALRSLSEIVYNFGLSEWIRVKQ